MEYTESPIQKSNFHCKYLDKKQKYFYKKKFCFEFCTCDEKLNITCSKNDILNNSFSLDDWKVINFFNISIKFIKERTDIEKNKTFFSTTKLTIFNGFLKDFENMKKFPNLVTLDLSKNRLNSINSTILNSLNVLQNLILTKNNLIYLNENGKNLLPNSLLYLNITFSNFDNIHSNFLSNLNNLKIFDLSHSIINEYSKDILNNLNNLHEFYMKNITFKQKHFTKAMFNNFESIELLITDKYKFCCFINSRKVYCEPKKSDTNSCGELINSIILKGKNK